MIALRLIGNTPEIDPRFLDISDVPFILLAITLIFISYYKIRKRKQRKDLNNSSKETENQSIFNNYDVLMQPKKNSYDDQLPFINFSMKSIYFGLGILFVYILIISDSF